LLGRKRVICGGEYSPAGRKDGPLCSRRERLARLDGERTKLGDQLNELEIAEGILTLWYEKANTIKKENEILDPITVGPKRLWIIKTRPPVGFRLLFYSPCSLPCSESMPFPMQDGIYRASR
jgi:hypothetical protein